MIPGRFVGIAAAVSAVLAAGAAWQIQSWRYEARIAGLVATHGAVMQGYADAAYAASEQARTEEQRRIAAVEDSTHETDRLLAQVVADERAAADVRVQRTADAAAARYRALAERAATAAEREAASAAIGMFAQLLSRSDDLAGIYAAHADESRVAGLGCERAYEAVRGLHGTD